MVLDKIGWSVTRFKLFIQHRPTFFFPRSKWLHGAISITSLGSDMFDGSWNTHSHSTQFRQHRSKTVQHQQTMLDNDWQTCLNCLKLLATRSQVCFLATPRIELNVTFFSAEANWAFHPSVLNKWGANLRWVSAPSWTAWDSHPLNTTETGDKHRAPWATRFGKGCSFFHSLFYKMTKIVRALWFWIIATVSPQLESISSVFSWKV